jgi:hypothetical protein
MTRKVIQGNVITNHLAENFMEDYEPSNFDFLNKNVMVI